MPASAFPASRSAVQPHRRAPSHGARVDPGRAVAARPRVLSHSQISPPRPAPSSVCLPDGRAMPSNSADVQAAGSRSDDIVANPAARQVNPFDSQVLVTTVLARPMWGRASALGGNWIRHTILLHGGLNNRESFEARHSRDVPVEFANLTQAFFAREDVLHHVGDLGWLHDA